MVEYFNISVVFLEYLVYNKNVKSLIEKSSIKHNQSLKSSNVKGLMTCIIILGFGVR